MSTRMDMSDEDEVARKLAKAAKKEKKRKAAEVEQQRQTTPITPSHTSTSSSSHHRSDDDDDDDAEDHVSKKARKAAKRAERAAEAAASVARAAAEEASIAAIEADNEKSLKKRHKKEKREESRKNQPTADGVNQDAAEEEEEEEDGEKAKKAKKAAKRAREAEVLAAGALALQEEADEEVAAVTAAAEAETDEQRRERKRAKKEKKAKEAAAAAAAAASSSSSSSSSDAAAAASSSSSSTSASSTSDPAAEPKRWPTPPPGNTTLLLFYQYVRPSWSSAERQAAENFTRDSLTRHGCTGRLRCAREGFNATLTGPPEGIRGFCQDLREYQPEHFANTDFKLVDGLRDNQMLRGLKVWHVDELVTYGFGHTKGIAPIEQGGIHLKPRDWHDKAAEDNTVLIDVRNANENAIGRFQPLGDASRVLDPYMRVSTEFGGWVDDNMDKLKKAKNIMMYCTGGIRCERASALLVQKGLDTNKVYQLEGGIHRYLEEFKDGGHWIGKNYVFDRRFAHGAVTKTPEVVGRCACCEAPWDRYQAGKKCFLCRMEVLVCRECERSGKFKTVKLKCHLCGGPKPSYLPADEKIWKPKPKKNAAEGKVEAEY